MHFTMSGYTSMRVLNDQYHLASLSKLEFQIRSWISRPSIYCISKSMFLMSGLWPLMCTVSNVTKSLRGTSTAQSPNKDRSELIPNLDQLLKIRSATTHPDSCSVYFECKWCPWYCGSQDPEVFHSSAGL